MVMPSLSFFKAFSEFDMDALGLASKLTEVQKKQICSLLGNVKLHLLYKASAHGYTASAFHQRCDHQGPTLIVAYSNSGDIFGGYTSKHYTQSEQYINDEKAFLFRLQGRTPVQFNITTPDGSNARYDDYTGGPCFGEEVYFLYMDSAQVYCNVGDVYRFNENDHSVKKLCNRLRGSIQTIISSINLATHIGSTIMPTR